MENMAPQSWLTNYLAPLAMAGEENCRGQAQHNNKRQAPAAEPRQRTAFNDITNNAHVRLGAGLDKAAKAADAKAMPQHHLELSSAQFSDPSLIDGQHQADKRRRDWIDVDAMNVDDPASCSHYAQAIFTYLREAEKLRRANPLYLEQTQSDVNAKMRAILVDWLVEVAEEYKLCADTLYLTVSYIDRFLSLHVVQRSHLQLVGVACMWVASKYEEIYPPNVSDFCYITDNTYTREQMVNMEETILKKLGYELTVPTAKTFLRRLLQVCNPDEHLHFLSNYLTELSLLDHTMMRYLPSEIAAASVYLANLMLKRQPWDGTLQHYSTYCPQDISQCVQTLGALHQAISSNNQLQAIKEKYAHARFQSVSRIPSVPNLAQLVGY